VLAAGPLVGGAGGMGKDGLGGGKDRGPLPGQAVEGAGGGQALDLAAVQLPRIDALGEIVEAFEWAVRLPLRNEGFHRFFADALQGTQGIADLAILDGEIRARRIDVRRQQFEPGAPDVLGSEGELVGLRLV
jgi:hypothetical protein